MLVRLYGKNFRSLKQEFELSMVAAEFTREEDSNRSVIELPITGDENKLKLLRSVAIYGPNASGKSTILTAARALRWLGTDSSRVSKPGGRIPPYEPFLLDEASKKKPIQLGCDVYYHGSILRYELEYQQKEILTERMCVINGDDETILINRSPSEKIGGDLIERSNANRLYVKEMQPNVSVLSKLAQHGPHKGKESANPFYTAIRNATNYANYSNSVLESVSDNKDRFADDATYRNWIMKHLISAADIGICDVETKREKIDMPDLLRESLTKLSSELKIPDKAVIVSFIHQGTTKQAIDYSDESLGTKKLFNFASDWWKLANESVSIFVDEISASLHPKLLDWLIRAVNSEQFNKKESQLIFATHDTSLLEGQDGLPPALRRDQVYFTRKNAKGESSLYSLAEFKESARPVHNLRKRYLSGVYDAIPNVKRLSL